MLFQQATQAQDADPLGNALDAGQAYELPAQRGLEQGFFSAKCLASICHCASIISLGYIGGFCYLFRV